uniref:Protein phosphatase 4 regulatory subunit 2 n=1 Tax=Theropithecus gelada TaxID=9565 RepID=A0A8D2FGZ3_THEGE
MDVERLQEALRDFEKRRGKEVCPVLDQILKIVAGFNGIPFTVQRLCELLTDPRRNYTGTDKFLRGVEKNVMVISCVYPSSEKNNSNSLNRMNGVMFPGNSPSYTERSNINGSHQIAMTWLKHMWRKIHSPKCLYWLKRKIKVE